MLISFNYWRWKTKLKSSGEEGAALRGQLDALTKQLQRDENEAQSLRQDEQALTQQWQAVTASLNITLQPQDDIQPWLDAQDEHERQLRLLANDMNYKGRLPRIISKLSSINSKLNNVSSIS